jgi:GMP synthase-like glutamine amidotransferase
MRTFLVITADPFAPAGALGSVILEAGDYYDTIMPTERHTSWAQFEYPGIPSEPENYAGLIVMGGAMSANDVDEHPYLLEIEHLARRFDDAGRPVLGVCLGAQIVARAWGGEVYSMGGIETGFVEVELTQAGTVDPVLGGVDPSFYSFQNHYEAIRGVPGLENLITGGACDIQAFKIGERVYGTQFHVEVTLDIARGWYRVSGKTLYRDAPYMKHEFDRGFMAHYGQHKSVSERIVRQWMNLARNA